MAGKGDETTGTEQLADEGQRRGRGGRWCHQPGGQREVIRGQGGQGADVQVIFGAFEQTPVIELLHFSRQPEGNRSDYSGPVQIEALPFLPSISAFSQWSSPSS